MILKKVETLQSGAGQTHLLNAKIIYALFMSLDTVWISYYGNIATIANITTVAYTSESKNNN